MKLSTLLNAAALSTPALGAVDQRCFAFEDPKSRVNSTSLEISSQELDTSVLVYHMSDIPHLNIPLVVDEGTLLTEPNGFAMCTSKRFSMGLCGDKNVGEFIYTDDGELQDRVLNRVIAAGEPSTSYEVEHAGVYCLIAYQEGQPEVKGVTTIENHWYGYIPLAQWESVKVMYALASLLVLTQIFIYAEFPGARKVCTGTLLDDIKLVFTMKAVAVSAQLLVFGVLLFTPNYTFEIFNPFICIDSLYQVGIAMVFYKVSTGMFGISKETLASFIVEKKFALLLKTYIAASVVMMFAPLLRHLPLLSSAILLAGFTTTFATIPMYVMMWRNAKAAEQESMDPVFQRNFRLSRKCALWIPVTLGAISGFGQIVTSMLLTPNLGTFDAIFAQAMELAISQDLWFVLLKHLPDFSMFVVLWTFIGIWKPHMFERTEEVYSNQLSDELHSALKL